MKIDALETLVTNNAIQRSPRNADRGCLDQRGTCKGTASPWQRVDFMFEQFDFVLVFWLY